MAVAQGSPGLLQSLSGFHLSQRGLGKDMIADSKYMSQVNTREGAEVFKLKDDVGTRTDDYK